MYFVSPCVVVVTGFIAKDKKGYSEAKYTVVDTKECCVSVFAQCVSVYLS